MLTVLRVVLRLDPAVETLEQSSNAISRYLGPPQSLPFHEACQFGSIELLDWIWGASCTHAGDRTPGWYLNNSLRSDPHYHQWQFSRSLEVAAGRGDLRMVKWLFAHFSGCEAPASVAEEAKRKGYLLVLRFLWSHKSGGQPTDDHGGMQTECSVCFSRRADFWTVDTIEKACDNGQLAQCLDEGMQINQSDGEIAIKRALCIGDLELAERLLPTDRSVFDYAAGCTRVEVIEKMLECGYLQRDELTALSMIPSVARSGRLDLLESVVHLCSSLPQNQEYVATWISAMEMACRHGHLAVLQWLVGHSSWSEARGRARNDSDISCLLPAAVKGGHIAVMEFLYSQGLALQFRRAMKVAVKNGDANSAKWLLDHCSFDECKLRKLWVNAINTSVDKGYLEILELFNALDVSTHYKQLGAKRRRSGRANSWWHRVENPMYVAASEGHIDILEWFLANPVKKGTTDMMDVAASHGYLHVVKWLHQNRSEGCTEDAIDSAAGNGHLDVVKWLHANRFEGCSELAMHRAAENGHLEMVKWLYMNIPESRAEAALDRAVQFRHFRVACWLQPRFPGFRIGSTLVSDSLVYVDTLRDSANTFETLLWLHECYNYVFTSGFLRYLRSQLVGRRKLAGYRKKNRPIKDWFEVHYPLAVKS